MDIPNESDSNLLELADTSLIHELDDLIRRGFVHNGGFINVTAAAQEPDSACPTAGETAGFDGIPPKSDGPESLLHEMGGIATLEGFLREYALLRGYARLGKNIREQLTTGLHSLAQHGKTLAITSGVIQLL